MEDELIETGADIATNIPPSMGKKIWNKITRDFTYIVCILLLIGLCLWLAGYSGTIQNNCNEFYQYMLHEDCICFNLGHFGTYSEGDEDIQDLLDKIDERVKECGVIGSESPHIDCEGLEYDTGNTGMNGSGLTWK